MTKHSYLGIHSLIGIFIILIVSGIVISSSQLAHALPAEPPRAGIVYYCVDTEGPNGATNLLNVLVDDGRFGSVELVDGEAERPTTQDLLSRFDCVISTISDAFCEDPDELRQEGALVLADYAKAGRGLVISTFGFSTGLGFGPDLFGPGLSPFQKEAGPNAPAGPVNVAGAADNPQACARMLSGVGPFSTFFANFVSLSEGASLCASYDNGRGFLAINGARNVIGLNTFPTVGVELADPSNALLVSNTVFEACSLKASRPIPTLSEWGLITMAAILGLFGLLTLRRRNAAAKG